MKRKKLASFNALNRSLFDDVSETMQTAIRHSLIQSLDHQDCFI